MIVSDTHDADIDFESHVVGCESHQSRRDTERHEESGFIGSSHGGVGGEFGLRAAQTELHLREKSESLAVAERDILPPDDSSFVRVLERIIGVGREVDSRILVTEFDARLIDFQKSSRVGKAGSDGHILFQGIGQNGGDSHGVSHGVDPLYYDKRIVVVRVGRERGRCSGNPLSFRDEGIAHTDQSPFLFGLVDHFLFRNGIDRRFGRQSIPGNEKTYQRKKNDCVFHAVRLVDKFKIVDDQFAIGTSLEVVAAVAGRSGDEQYVRFLTAVLFAVGDRNGVLFPFALR